MTVAADASAVVDFLLGGPRGRRVGSQLGDADLMVAPELIVVEVLSAMNRLRRSDQISNSDATAAASDLSKMPIRHLSHAPLADRVWLLRDRVRIADAFYVAAAQLVDAPLLTTNSRLARAALPGVTITLIN